MKYLLLICADQDAEVTPEDDAGMAVGTADWVTEMDGRGVRLDGNRLRPAGDATSVRVRGGEVVVDDGPFADAEGRIAGYDVIECADLDEAIEVAGKHPVARFGTIDVRPVW
ncbi:YciI family protein [Kitasatospora sp. NPDC059722]|uniref:YciI family protein n=1 Tax=Streptomycetaceae TaxID=2062 RepID=UPI002E787B78|nr:YciI family protein [Streptomyces sp. SP17BM10]MEE1784604.1 YciI family protein [Streptomyces sp. SP17BM10]